jgi:histidinol phosphatase-like PHP family hydrolase
MRLPEVQVHFDKMEADLPKAACDVIEAFEFVVEYNSTLQLPSSHNVLRSMYYLASRTIARTWS